MKAGRSTAGPRVFLLLLVCAAAPAALAAELTHEQRLHALLEAQQSFDRGAELRRTNPAESAAALRAARERFRLVIESGVRNGGLYYNLANTCLQLGEIGPALLNYRRAERLRPGDGRIEANLRYARELRRNRIDVSAEKALLRTLFFWHYGSRTTARFAAASALYALLWLLVFARLFVGRVKWGWAVVPTLLIFAVLAGSVAVDALGAGRVREGVILADDVTARKGNGDGFEPQFKEKLHAGVEFRLLEQRGEWMQIELPDRKSGWIRARDAELL